MTADEAKTYLFEHLLLVNKRIAVVSEYRGMDVYAITKSLYGAEYEIKVTKADLIREKNAIEAALSGFKNIEEWNGHAHTKRLKHETYLQTKDKPTWMSWRPNEYWFFVPEELENEAIKTVKNTPYGVMLYTKKIQRESWAADNFYTDNFYHSVKAKKLHKDKVEVSELISFMRKVSTENYYTRQKLINSINTKEE